MAEAFACNESAKRLPVCQKKSRNTRCRSCLVRRAEDQPLAFVHIPKTARREGQEVSSSGCRTCKAPLIAMTAPGLRPSVSMYAGWRFAHQID